MTDEEILAEIAKVQFDAPKDSEVIVNVPLYIPKALFMNWIKGFAVHKGWSEKITADTDGVLSEIDNPESSLKYLASEIRKTVKSEFKNFAQLKASAQAQEQVNQMLNSIGL